jgi:putative ABC transport system permease protein
MFASRHLLLLLSLRHLGRHKLRTLLTLAGIVVGVATFVFAPTLASSIAQAFDAATSDLMGHAQLEITGKDEGFSRRALTIARGVGGVDIAAPQVKTVAVPAGRSEPLMVLGIEPNLDHKIRTYTLTAGRFLQRSGEILLSEKYARELKLRPGDRLKLIGPGGDRRYRVAGLLAAAGAARLNNGDVVVLAYQDAQDLRGNANLDSIALTLRPEVDLESVRLHLQAALPGSLTVESVEARRGPLADIRSIVTFMMGFASLMILAAGSTLVYNTMAVAVAQRRTEIGVLRALGLTRRHIQVLFLLEAAVLGLLGAMAGVVAGYALTQASRDAIDLSNTFSSGLSTNVVIEVPGWLIGLAVVAGTAVPVAAAYLPARTAARLDPIEALSGLSAETRFLRTQRRRTLAGLLLVFGGVGIFLDFAANQTRIPFAQAMPQVVAAMFTLLIAVILLLPAVIVALGRVAPGLMHRLFGITGLLAAEHLTKQSRRLTATGAVILLGAWAAITVSSGNFGYREFSDEWQANQNVWDLTIAGAGPSKFRSSVSLPAGLIDQLQRRRDIRALVVERRRSVESAYGDVEIRSLDVAAYHTNGARFLWDKGDESAAYTRLTHAAPPALLLSSFASAMQHLRPGGVMTLTTPRGPVPFEIAGTILGAIDPVAMGETTVVMDRAAYRQFWGDAQIDRVMLKLAPNVDTQALRRELQHDYPDGGFVVISPGELSAGFSAAIDNMVITSQLLSLLLLLTLTLGIANTLVIEVLDRRREMGLLRAIGLRGRQVAALLVLEVLLLGALVSFLAIPLGLFNNYANSLLMGELFSIRFILDPIEVALTLGLLLSAAMLASYFPARQAGRVDVIEALHYE